MKRILLTRPRSQAEPFAVALRQAGFEPLFFPVIEIHPWPDTLALDQALHDLPAYAWIVFTSVNGVAQVCRRMEELGITALPNRLRVAAIGPKTAEALARHGLSPAFVPVEYVAEAILPGLGDLRDRWVLLPRAEIARPALPQAILQAGGTAHEIAVYRTLPAHPDAAGLAALRQGVDVVTLTSPSTVENFFALARQHLLDPLSLPGNPFYVCIGPITAQAARERGVERLAMAEEYTTDGLLRVIQRLE